MMEAGPKAHGLFCEPVVKIEPPEDVKDIKTTNAHSDSNLDFFVNHSSQTPSIWPYLLKTVR